MVEKVYPDLDLRLVVSQFEYVDVVFLTADADLGVGDTVIKATDPAVIRYEVVSADRATAIYNDMSATRRAWTQQQIFLRSSAANARVRLRLTVEP